MRRALLAASLLALSASGCAAARGGSARPLHGVLAYAKPYARLTFYTGHHENVWVAGADGRHPRLLGVGVQPAVSPDGRLVAFTRGATVFVVPSVGGDGVLGGGARPLATFPNLNAYASYPVWAPDSRHLGMVDTSGRLWVLDADTGAKTVVHAPGVHEGAFSLSPDARRVVYEDHGDLYVVPTNGGRRLRLTADGKDGDPVWGKRGIAFARGFGDIWLTKGKPGRARQVTHTNANLSPLFFSADGTKLLARGSSAGELWAVDVRTGAARMLVGPSFDLVPEGLSSDGEAALAGVGCGGENATPYGYVETIPFDGRRPRVLVRGACQASWGG